VGHGARGTGERIGFDNLSTLAGPSVKNLIVRRRRGKHINYALVDQHVMELLSNALEHATERPAAIPRNDDLEEENNT
jgi:hypothetical protein